MIAREVPVTRTVSKNVAKEFYRDLCGTVYGNANKNRQGRMSVELIAVIMNISVDDAERFCNAMIKYDITDRSGGMIVV